KQFTCGIVRLDNGPLALDLESGLRHASALTVRTYASESALSRAVATGDVVSGVVVDPGYDAALRSGGATKVRFYNNFSPAAVLGRQAVAAVVDGQAARVAAAHFSERRAGDSFPDAYAASSRA